MAFTPLAGSAGRIRLGSASTGVAGITAWEIESSLEALKVTNFESAVDANSVIGEEKISSNIADFKGNLTGWYDSDTANSDATFGIGVGVVIDFLYAKATALGFHNKTALITRFRRGPKLREAQGFTIDFELSGPLGVPSAS